MVQGQPLQENLVEASKRIGLTSMRLRVLPLQLRRDPTVTCSKVAMERMCPSCFTLLAHRSSCDNEVTEVNRGHQIYSLSFPIICIVGFIFTIVHTAPLCGHTCPSPTVSRAMLTPCPSQMSVTAARL